MAWTTHAFKTVSVLQKRFNNKLDDLAAPSAEVKLDLEAAWTHLHKLEGYLDA
jgi:hypothetical protein